VTDARPLSAIPRFGGVFFSAFGAADANGFRSIKDGRGRDAAQTLHAN
jgi:hypothetical protein